GADNDGDGLTDFPNDPGCADRVDPDEADPDPLPQCANGEDDDEDGNIDYPLDADSCFFAADDTEDDPCSRREAVEITGLRDVRGNTNEESDDFRASCSPFGDRESLLLWRVAEDRPLAGITFSTRGTNFDTVVYVRDACGGEELGCDDDSGPDFGTSFLTLGAQAPGTELFIFVDAGFTGSGGIWRLRVIPQLAEGANCAAPGTWTCAEGLECRDGAGGATCQRTICANGVDDDEDGLVDWPLDPGCVTPSDSDEADPELVPQCFNGVDDDEDGLIDFDAAGGGDPGCSATADDFEGPDCADGIDNNGNGAADYDRDGDGVRDPASDRGCACAADPSEDIQPQCNDGCDNDRDGVIDLEDPGCDDAEDDNEFHFPECIDRIDNDGDGLVDYPNDPGCTNEDDPVERNPDVLPACADGVDNDEDGRIDFAVDGTGDDGCLAAADDDENGPCDGELPALPPDGSARGTTTGRLNEHRGSCTVGDAPEVAWRVSLPYPAFVRANTFGSVYDTALYARNQCAPETACPVPDPEDPDPEPCAPEPTELDCNDDTDGLQSEVVFDWPGGDFFLFVDGFGDGFGDYQLAVTAILPLGGQCGPDAPEWALCEAGTACLADEAAGFPTCQRPE
ncbi:MAG: hypothetical protein KC613_20305, partial [Myxococcales bacterium]|nr:hypothetical protein [Myxococcales bacterium]